MSISGYIRITHDILPRFFYGEDGSQHRCLELGSPPGDQVRRLVDTFTASFDGWYMLVFNGTGSERWDLLILTAHLFSVLHQVGVDMYQDKVSPS